MSEATTHRFRQRPLASIIASVALLWTAPALATSSLSFEGGGYWIDMEVGMDPAPVLASVRFHAPGDAQGVVLPRDHWQVQTFDTERQILLLEHRGGTVAPFSLSVRQEAAVLTIGERKIQSRFAWDE